MRCVIISRGCTLAARTARVLHQAPASGQKTQKGLLIVLVSTKGGRGGDSGEPPAEDGRGTRCNAESLRMLPVFGAWCHIHGYGNISLPLRTRCKKCLNTPKKRQLLARFCWFPHFPEPAVAAEWIRNCRRGAFFQRAPREVGLLLSVYCFGCLRMLDTHHVSQAHACTSF